VWGCLCQKDAFWLDREGYETEGVDWVGLFVLCGVGFAQVSELFHAGKPGAQFQPDNTRDRVSGPAPNHASHSSFATFSNPDGNGWLVPGGYDAAARSCRFRDDQLRVGERSGECVAACGGGSRRAREANQASRPGLVCRVHGARQAGESLPQ
jgi:hypothetical protein